MDLTPSDEGMAAILFEIATNSTKPEDKAWARRCLIKNYRPENDA